MNRLPDATPDGHGLSGVADAGAFLARLVRLDGAALVRLRPAGRPGRTALWGRLPWGVLVTRTVDGARAEDVTVAAGQLLAVLDSAGQELPARRDHQWRWPLPGTTGRVVETMPAVELRRIALAAAGALRTASTHGVAGRRVGERMLRDALLDHVAVVVTGPPDWHPDAAMAVPPVGAPSGPRSTVAGSGRPAAPTTTTGVAQGRVEVPQRLVQAVHRMGFLGPDRDASEGQVGIVVTGRWVGLAAPYGVAWLPKANHLLISRTQGQPNG